MRFSLLRQVQEIAAMLFSLCRFKNLSANCLKFLTEKRGLCFLFLTLGSILSPFQPTGYSQSDALRLAMLRDQGTTSSMLPGMPALRVFIGQVSSGNKEGLPTQWCLLFWCLFPSTLSIRHEDGSRDSIRSKPWEEYNCMLLVVKVYWRSLHQVNWQSLWINLYLKNLTKPNLKLNIRVQSYNLFWLFLLTSGLPRCLRW